MLIWIVFAVFAVLSVLALVVPLVRPLPVRGGTAGDVDVYKDQLQNLDKEVAAGLVTEAEAESLRAEIARRLLAADRRAHSGPSAEPRAASDPQSAAGRSGHRLWAWGLAALVPLFALGFYLLNGMPTMPDQPYAERLERAGETGDLSFLIYRAEKALENNPSDIEGWRVLAPVYMQAGRFDEAAAAYGRLLELEGPSARLHALRGEALVFAARGRLTPDAEAAFEKALELEAANAEARFYLALGAAQAGHVEAALAVWRSVLADIGEDAPMATAVRAQIARAEAALAETSAEPSAEPSAEAPAETPTGAALDLPEGQRAMVEGMVGGLAERLSQDPDDLEGWLMLIRSYRVLGREEEAAAALAEARRQFADDPEALESLSAAASAE